MKVYKPKHKKKLGERLDNSFLYSELQSTDVYLGFAVYDYDELMHYIKNDIHSKPMDYYQDEIFLIKYVSMAILLFIVFVLSFYI